MAQTSAPSAHIELVSLRELSGEFVWYHVEAVSAVAGSDLRTLELPEGCLVTLIERGRDVVVPKGSTRLEPGDHVCVYVLPAERTLLDLLFGGAED